MHLKPISRELRRELYGRRKKGYNSYHLPYTCCSCICTDVMQSTSFFTSTAAIGLAQGKDDLAQETETGAEEAATATGAAPETDSAQADSDLSVMANCPSLHMSAQGFYKVCTLPNPFVYELFFFMMYTSIKHLKSSTKLSQQVHSSHGLFVQ